MRAVKSSRNRQTGAVISCAISILIFSGLSSDANQKSVAKSKSDGKIYANLSKPVTLDFTETPFSDAIEYLKEATGQSILLDKESLAEEGISGDAAVTLNVKDISAGSALKHLTRQLGVTFVVQKGAAVIVTRPDAENREFQHPAKIIKGAEARIKKSLAAKNKFSFLDVPLTDVVDYIRQLSGQNILFDQIELNDAGIDMNAAITLEFEGTLDQALKQALKMADAKFIIDHEVILIVPASAEKGER